MQLLVDRNLDVRVAEALRQQDHDVKHLREEGLQRLPNGDIFAKAIAEKQAKRVESRARGEFRK